MGSGPAARCPFAVSRIVLDQLVETVIRRGLARSDFGSSSWSTPFFIVARMCSASMSLESVKRRT
jgi:hypothetical protein